MVGLTNWLRAPMQPVKGAFGTARGEGSLARIEGDISRRHSSCARRHRCRHARTTLWPDTNRRLDTNRGVSSYEAGRDHLAGQAGSLHAPDREHRSESGTTEPVFPIPPDFVEELGRRTPGRTPLGLEVGFEQCPGTASWQPRTARSNTGWESGSRIGVAPACPPAPPGPKPESRGPRRGRRSPLRS